jgi:hypothetical protein
MGALTFYNINFTNCNTFFEIDSVYNLVFDSCNFFGSADYAIDSENSTFTFTNCTVDTSSVINYAGIYANFSVPSIYNSSFVGCGDALAILHSNATVSNVLFVSNGIGISATGLISNVTDCFFSLHRSYAFDVQNSTMLVSGTTFLQNTQDAYTSYSIITLTNNVFENTTNYSIDTEESTVSVSNTSFVKCRGITWSLVNSTFTGSNMSISSSGYAGKIYSGNFTLHDSSITNCTFSGLIASSAILTISGSHFANNTGFDLQSTDTDVTLSQSTFQSGTSISIQATKSSFQITDCSFISYPLYALNVSEGRAGLQNVNFTSSILAGNLYNTSFSYTLGRCVGNAFNLYGGTSALFSYVSFENNPGIGISATAGDLTITSCTFSNGAVALVATGTSVTFAASTIERMNATT